MKRAALPVIAVTGLALIVAALLVLAFWIRADEALTCERLHARYVNAGSGRYLCVSPDGKVITP
jgi:hypothetical protein